MNEAVRPQFAAVDFPVYGLDEMWRGRRWLGSVCSSAAGRVECVTLGHGDWPSRRPDDPSPGRFVTVVTVPRRPRRHSGDGGFLDATSPATAAAVAGVGLLEDCWPWHIGRELRNDWLRQQIEVAYHLAERLDDEELWRPLSLTVQGKATVLRYREAEYGWVLVGEAPDAYVGLYGRGVSPHGLGLAQVKDFDEYADPAG
ncbi:hypothetical protein [Carbonactinospora thermoautotrophica]|uniref:Uncharacterized protein n=1 Tax=Carbonactinospora thermoautotrophica TaxID=1469144 RepID=A0A132MN38_9ACTN|nr:hypothetical protein [Carbonactinospora thermoautotrophica]KWW99277.1 hypothetical protein LI90_911 [Carbonactinospora thermoautotrophica]